MSRVPEPLRTDDELPAALDAPVAVVYKHSPLCGRSARALMEVQRFMAERPDVPVYLVDVIQSRPLSRELADRLDVRHESPQALVLRDGRVSWHGSHEAVTAAALDAALD
jgi:bacillithiol system protein YtxJ